MIKKWSSKFYKILTAALLTLLFLTSVAVLAPQPETNNYMAMEADSGSLKLGCYLPDGTKVDETVAEK